MESSENAGFRSGLRPPQVRAPVSSPTAATSYLQEITDSQHNARSQQPSGIPQKRTHKGSISYPDQKRKTLVERAGEPIKSGIPSVAAGLPRAGTNVKGASIASLSANSSTATSRYAQTSNFAKSVGPGARPPVMARAPTSMGFAQSTTTRPRGLTRPRPATAMANRELEDEPLQTDQKKGWDVDGRLSEFETQFKVIKETVEGTMSDRKILEEAIELAKNRASDLEREKQRLIDQNAQLQNQLDLQRQENSSLQQEKQMMALQMETEQRRQKYELDDRQREHRLEVDQIRRDFESELDRLKREHQAAAEARERQYQAELAEERTQKSRELQDLRSKLGAEQQDLNLELLKKEREVQEMRSQVEALKSDLDREQTIKATLQKQIAEMTATNVTLEERMRGLRAKIDFLESDSKQQADSYALMEARLQEALRVAEEARQKLIKEETERRVLFNKYQELKGNIRVMCRVRPILDPSEGEEAKIAFPDTKTSSQIDVTGPEEKSSLGVVSRKVIPFEFDRVFDPSVQNEEIFGEISQLVQSALDGYNVCIFCYGQTGSGKTYTMSSPDGMIPRATHMIYDTITKLQEKSWTYTMEGSFVEVYNEELHDLLTPSREADPRKKLEIRHDDVRKQTTVVNCKTVALDSPEKVEAMLKQAQSNRSVAATKANERSSRSHSVFILKLVGENSATNERCEGTLNLVDLAGSERLKHSQAEGDRMKETQNINKSLACLGDVIEALGRGSAHVPYRNSKLTHLLQYSLGGNSKTLMFVMVSPLEAHLKETITSLRFATKVHNTHIGTAKSTKKLRSATPESAR
ncbi:P-loop containing nucleoside triphosphate hydrolase protein [Thermothelomyces heterothallicus CBS 202.75]|uniref:P-loop containing nucleoside triphosphate hydrolase protein n=1 Tax=Thermothelomyces heterothallicus CBS 202.75 TaxID=1149848 RepID=UPI00374349DF